MSTKETFAPRGPAPKAGILGIAPYVPGKSAGPHQSSFSCP